MEKKYIDILMEMSYRLGWNHGRGGKDLPTNGHLRSELEYLYDNMVRNIKDIKEQEANEQ